MYIMLALALLCGSVTAGYLTGHDSSSVTEQQILDRLAQEKNAPPSESLGFALSVVVQEGKRADGAKVSGKLAVETALDAVELTSEERKLYRALGEDETGLKLRRALIAGNHQSDIPGVDLYMKNFLADLFSNPGY